MGSWNVAAGRDGPDHYVFGDLRRAAHKGIKRSLERGIECADAAIAHYAAPHMQHLSTKLAAATSSVVEAEQTALPCAVLHRYAPCLVERWKDAHRQGSPCLLRQAAAVVSGGALKALQEPGWKKAAGRADGPEHYAPGDGTRYVLRHCKRQVSESATGCSSGPSPPVVRQTSSKRFKSALDETADEFLCPITMALPADPVTAMDGHIYERWAIEQWIARGSGKSPLTNQRMGAMLLRAPHVKNTIERMVASGALADDKVAAWRAAQRESDEQGSDRVWSDAPEPPAVFDPPPPAAPPMARRQRSEDAGAPARWHYASECECRGCEARFGLLLAARHHCRRCGASVCDAHFVRPFCGACARA
jgi:hypothetical protein